MSLFIHTHFIIIEFCGFPSSPMDSPQVLWIPCKSHGFPLSPADSSPQESHRTGIPVDSEGVPVQSSSKILYGLPYQKFGFGVHWISRESTEIPKNPVE